MNTDARFQRVKEIFLAAIEAPDAERSQVVSAAAADDPVLVADVLALLDHHARPSPLLREAPASMIEVKASSDALPLSMGRYVLERLLGEGATGRVFAAVQKSPRRTVAIKLLRPGLQSHTRTTERFLREAELLAKLDHPGIARVFESGAATLPWGPQAFIAMELIEGLPLTEFAARHKLSVPARLELLAKVCDAVAYSHAHGVIHRDLKPSNVLVLPDGQPRVLDFGVAHAIYDETGTQPTLGGDLVGTLAYMSPEYAQGLDRGGAQCDIYSLGVMAYELVSGTRPIVTEGATIWDAMRAIGEHRFPSLRERTPSCGVDLDLVVENALRFDPRERYQSAADLGADLRRVIASRPVSVRRLTVGYRLAKFLSRTRKASIVGAITIALLLAGGVLSVRQWMLTRTRLQEVTLTLDYSSKLPRHRPGVTPPDAIADTLSDVSRLAASELRGHPIVEAGVQYRIGVEYLGTLGRFAEAERMLQRAIGLSGSRGLEDPLVADVTLRLAALSLWRDNAHVFEESVRRLVHELSRRGDEPLKLYYARRQLSWYLSTRGPSEELTSQLEAMDALAKSLGEPFLQTHEFDAACVKASAMFYSGRAREALSLLPPLEDIKDGLVNTPWLMSYRNAAHLGAFVQVALGHIDAARDLLHHLLRASIAELGPKSFETVSIRTRLAGLLWLQGDLAAAEREFADIAIFAGPEGLDDPVLRGNAINSRGVCLRDLGRFAEAESVLNEALSIRLKNGGPDGATVADTRMNLASLYVRWERGREALVCAEEAARIRRVRGRWTPPLESESRAMIGRARMLIDGPAAALDELQRAWQIRWDCGLLLNWHTDVAVDGLIAALVAMGRTDEAQRIAEQEHAKLLEIAGPENAVTKRAAERRERVVQRVRQSDATTVGG